MSNEMKLESGLYTLIQILFLILIKGCENFDNVNQEDQHLETTVIEIYRFDFLPKFLNFL